MKLNQQVVRFFTSTFVSFLFFYPLSVQADYTIVLENGRRITVQDYWEEGGEVKFDVLKGIMGLGVEKIRSIEDAKDTQLRGFVLGEMEKAWAEEEAQRQKALASKKAEVNGADVAKEKEAVERVEELLRAEREKGYQEMYKVLTGEIKSRTNLFWLLTRGTASPNPVLLESLEAIDGRIDDLRSRLKDAEIDLNRRSQGVVRLVTNSSFSGQWEEVELTSQGVVTPRSVSAQSFNVPRVARSLPSFTASEARLSNLRRQLEQLYDERNRLIENFKKQELFTGSLPYEAFP